MFNIRCRGLFIRDEKLLIVKHSEQAPHYALPGGHLERDESPLECLEREIKEELGIEIQSAELKYVYRWVNPKDTITNIEFIFLITDKIPYEIDIKDTSHAFEIFEILWVEKTDTMTILPKEIFKEFTENSFLFEGVKFI